MRGLIEKKIISTIAKKTGFATSVLLSRFQYEGGASFVSKPTKAIDLTPAILPRGLSSKLVAWPCKMRSLTDITSPGSKMTGFKTARDDVVLSAVRFVDEAVRSSGKDIGKNPAIFALFVRYSLLGPSASVTAALVISPLRTSIPTGTDSS